MSGRAATKNVIAGQYALSVGDAGMPSPPGWAWVPLTAVARLESGHTPSRRHPEWWGGDIPWIGIKDARPRHGKTIFSTKENTNEDGLANSAARLLPKGTVCLSRTASVGYVLVMGTDMATSQDFVNWVCSEAVVPDWLKHLLAAEQCALKSFSKGTTHSTIYFPEVKAFRVCLPPVSEQQRIVAKIDALQERSAAAKEALDAIPPLLERFRQSVLAAAFRGDLTREWREQHRDVEPAAVLLERIREERRRQWIGDATEKGRARAEARARKAGKSWGADEDAAAVGIERAKAERAAASPRSAGRSDVATEAAERVEFGALPSTWAVVRLGDIAELQPGYAFKSAWYSETGVRLLRGTNIVPGATRWEDTVHLPAERLAEFERYSLLHGDLVIAMDRPIISSGIKVARLTEADLPALLLQRVGRFVLADGIDPGFVQSYLEGPFFRQHVTGTATGTQLPHISGNDIESAPVPLPPLREQAAISQAISEELGLAGSAEESSREAHSALSSLDQSILAKAFRGELVPQDPDDEPASVLLDRIKVERAASEPTKKKHKARARRK